MTPIEALAVGVGVHLGKKTIDWIWNAIQDGKAPVANQSGNLGFTGSDVGRTLVSKEFTVTRHQVNELVFGNLYLPDTIIDFIVGDVVPLILIVEETQQQTFLFTADLEEGYEVYLPHGIYSFFVFLVDLDSEDFLDAEIYAIGFRGTVDLSNITRIDIDDHEDIWDVVSELPVEITSGGPYILDFILIDTDRVWEFPNTFSELVNAKRVCDTCLYLENEYSTDWRITKKGNLRCEECGTKNDFAECTKCDSIWFIETKKGNFRCFNCDKKLKLP